MTGGFTLTARVAGARGPLIGLMLRVRVAVGTRHLFFGAGRDGLLIFRTAPATAATTGRTTCAHPSPAGSTGRACP